MGTTSSKTKTEATKTGRKKNEEMNLLFCQTCMWLENDTSINSIQVFRRKMIEICEEEDKDKFYDAHYIRKLLKNRYRDFIWISEDV